MVEEKKAYRILYEMEIEIYGVDEKGYNYWLIFEPTDKDFEEALKDDIKRALWRGDSSLAQLNYWTSDEKVKRLSVERIRE